MSTLPELFPPELRPTWSQGSRDGAGVHEHGLWGPRPGSWPSGIAHCHFYPRTACQMCPFTTSRSCLALVQAAPSRPAFDTLLVVDVSSILRLCSVVGTATASRLESQTMLSTLRRLSPEDSLRPPPLSSHTPCSAKYHAKGHHGAPIWPIVV